LFEKWAKTGTRVPDSTPRGRISTPGGETEENGGKGVEKMDSGEFSVSPFGENWVHVYSYFSPGWRKVGARI